MSAESTLDQTRTGGTPGWTWPALICVYFAVQTAWRCWIGGNPGLDEAQMLLWSRHLAWGYGPQPPLYSWIQWAVFQLLGESLLALALVKNALLAGTWLCIYALLRSAFRPGIAALATASLLLLPQIAWESQRALTHTVLATMLAAATYLVFWTWVLGGRRGGYLLFGLIVGLGAIAKVNYLVAPLALLLAAALDGPARARLSLRGLALSVAIAGLIAAGPLLWVLENQSAALASTYKLGAADPARSMLSTALAGTGATLLAALLFTALPALVTGLIWWRNRAPSSAPPPLTALEAFFWRVQATGLAITLLTVLASEATNVKDRWMQPVLFLTAPLLACWLIARVREQGLRWHRRTIAACAALVFAFLPVELRTGLPGDPARGDAPVATAWAGLSGQFAPETRILAAPEWVAGTILLQTPARRITAAHSASLAPGEEAILVWTEDPAEGATLADAIGRRSGGRVRLGPVSEARQSYSWQPEETFILFAAPLRRE